MKIKEEQKEQIVNFGALSYNSKRMAGILDLEINSVKSEMDNINSEFHNLYIKGEFMADYVIDLKLFELAKTGDTKALKQLEIRKRSRE